MAELQVQFKRLQERLDHGDARHEADRQSSTRRQLRRAHGSYAKGCKTMGVIW